MLLVFTMSRTHSLRAVEHVAVHASACPFQQEQEVVRRVTDITQSSYLLQRECLHAHLTEIIQNEQCECNKPCK